MRVIAGRFRSRKLKSVPGVSVRPTPDRLREALFNVIAPRIAGTVFLDAYAGSGAVGIEALSRGARHVILVESNPNALAIIRDNLESLGITDEATLIPGSALSALQNYGADIAFLDPPYEQTNEYAAALLALSRTQCRLAIAQHASRAPLEEHYATLRRTRILRQGDNSLSFYQPDSAGE
ncbi:MAG: 16S rRNA (guanine(966)-N(2))-methyltransferase RsmD [Acidobacteriaceae bacterium]|nr:16S rRNA (guanine(966)-N(2))-methyltransferase RsmD [Acidobacteriaceae bacterium]MBV9296647.1 16S rRNA (guanine(966)-N(2))-methyltransferase RsmD [Acidobacteriaceae bacterium]MBV9767758.1 16S rRNA (guanine(966)-N(2))-methyltransferase RsmD [Acidobacteriaceae bacterium]